MVLTAPAHAAQEEWRSDWVVAPGLELEIDSTGFRMPTDLELVPEPGDEPSDPIYFVTELRGAIRVVTRDRSVRLFARVETPAPDPSQPMLTSLAGQAGLALDPEHGYVFVTHVFQDEAGLLRNRVTRFTCEPQTFSLQPLETVVFDGPIERSQSARSHQIGDCFVADSSLYIGVGDAGVPSASRDMSQMVGKVLRVTLDGAPHPSNPFADAQEEAARFVWAHGLRNPFAIHVSDAGVFTAENGNRFDRFIRVTEGMDHGWDGTDWSMGMNALAVFAPGVGPVHLDFIASDHAGLPERQRGRFVFSGSARESGVVTLRYDFDNARVDGVPETILEYAGQRPYSIVGLDVGSDGLYVAPFFPNRAGETPVFRLSVDPNADPAAMPTRPIRPRELIRSNGCQSCHYVDGVGPEWGPPLDDRGLALIAERINSTDYEQRLNDLSMQTGEPFDSTRSARDAVLAASGDARLEEYLAQKIRNPRFDDPGSWMPSYDFVDEEARALTSHLLAARDREAGGLLKRTGERLRSLFPFPENRPGDMLAGAAIAAIGLLALFVPLLWRARRKSRAT